MLVIRSQHCTPACRNAGRPTGRHQLPPPSVLRRDGGGSKARGLVCLPDGAAALRRVDTVLASHGDPLVVVFTRAYHLAHVIHAVRTHRAANLLRSIIYEPSC